MITPFPSYAQPWNLSTISFTDADSPAMIDIKYNGYKEATYKVEPTGVDSKFALTLESGSDSYIISGSSSGTQDKVAGTVEELVAAINALSEDVEGDHWGWCARRRNAQKDDSLDHADFDAVSKTDAGFNWTPLVQLDMSAADDEELSIVRLCNPDYDNMHPEDFGRMQVSEGMIALGYFIFNLSYSSGTPSLVVLDDEGNMIWEEDAASTTSEKEAPSSLCELANPLLVKGPISVGIRRDTQALTGITTARIYWKPWNL